MLFFFWNNLYRMQILIYLSNINIKSQIIKKKFNFSSKLIFFFYILIFFGMFCFFSGYYDNPLTVSFTKISFFHSAKSPKKQQNSN